MWNGGQFQKAVPSNGNMSVSV